MEQSLFKGTFTEDIRQAMRKRRHYLNISYDDISNLIGVQWTTYRKWEMGPTIKCHIKYVNKIDGFLSGLYDDTLTIMHKKRRNHSSNTSENNIRNLLTAMNLTIELTKDNPVLYKAFSDKVNAALTNTINQILPN